MTGGERILERVMIAFEGEGVPSWVEKRLTELPAAGVTLFMAVNVIQPGQVRELTAALQRVGGAGATRPSLSPPTRRAASSTPWVRRRPSSPATWRSAQ